MTRTVSCSGEGLPDPDDSGLDDLPPPPGPPLRIADAFQQALDAVTVVAPARPAPQPAPVLPTIHGYEVLSVLGRGSMGVVYQARQVGLKRLVALKMILAGGHAGPEQRERFRREAEAVARLAHPNIVQIHEVGEHQGLPFFSLEYVAGGTLARHLAGTPQPPRWAAQLVATLARAVQHAHDAGVVHRDLKPGNVLVGADLPVCPGEKGRQECLPPRVKIADFGLAKHLEDESRATGSGALLGTPSYMAPEQARGLGPPRSVGPAADVYGLGAILYECLTGRPPFLGQTALDTLEQVVSREPIPPSRLQPGVPRDLETVCLTCLHKEPGKRYASAADLAGDLERFLKGEPIHARPVGRLERLLKWVRRRPVPAGLAACCAVLALSLVAGGLVYNVRLRQALVLAEQERDRARAYRQRMLKTVDELLTQVGDERLADVPEMEPVRRQLLEEALRFYRDLLDGKDHADPDVRREAALAYRRTANINQLLDRLDQADRQLRAALALLEQLADEQPASPDCSYQQALCWADLGILHGRKGLLAEAESAYRQAITLLEPLPSGSPEYRRWLGIAHNGLGLQLWRKSAFQQAEGEHRQALAVQKALAGEYPDNPVYRIEQADSHHNLGMVYQTTARPALAESSYRAAEALLAPLAGDPAHLRSAGGLLSRLYHNWGRLLADQGRKADSVGLVQKGLLIRARLARRFPSTPGYRIDLAQTSENLAGIYQGLGQPEKALPHLRRSLEQWDSLANDFPRNARNPLSAVRICTALAMLLDRVGRPAEAEACYRDALGRAEVLGRDHPRDATCRFCLGQALLLLGHFQTGRKPAEALSLSSRAIAVLEDVLRQAPEHAQAHLFLRAAYEVRVNVREAALATLGAGAAGLGPAPPGAGPLPLAVLVLGGARQQGDTLKALEQDRARYQALEKPPRPAKPN